MNIFENYDPIGVDEKKKAALSAKMKNSQRRVKKKHPYIVQISTVVAAILVFVVGLSLFGGNIQIYPKKGTQQTKNTGNAKSEKPDLIAKQLTYAGKSAHWMGVNKVYTRSHFFKDADGELDSHSFETGTFELIYTGDTPDTVHGINFQVVGPNGSPSGTNNTLNGPNGRTLQSQDVLADQKDGKIKVSVQWNGHKESFTMKSDPKAFKKIMASHTPELSSVHANSTGTMGITGGGSFELASTIDRWGKLQKSWDTNFVPPDQSKKFPALLGTYGKHLTQSMFFLFSKIPTGKDIKVVGEHDGKKKTLFTMKAGSLILQNHFNSDIAVPVTLSFGKEGIWKLIAYGNGKKVDTLTVGVYQKPTYVYSSGYNMKGNSLKGFKSSFTSDQWHQKEDGYNGYPVLAKKPHMQIKIPAQTLRGKRITDPFPIVVTGVPVNKGKPFVQTFDQSDVKRTADGKFEFEMDLPIKQDGKWKLNIFTGEYPSIGLTFFVR